MIYEPVRDELFWAENGAGAFLNNQRLRVSARRALAPALLATGLPFSARPRYPGHVEMVRRLAGESAGVRRTGSTALDLAYVAAGRLDGYWAFGMEPWDLAAGIVIVREAGGIVTETGGGADSHDQRRRARQQRPPPRPAAGGPRLGGRLSTSGALSVRGINPLSARGEAYL